MTALITLTVTEARLFLRNPTSVFMALLLPSFLLLLQGFAIPGTMDLIGSYNPAVVGLRVIDFFVPMSITVALLSVAVTNYPSAIAAYRDSGVLRRLDVTPVGPHRVLLAQWLVSGASFVAAILVTVLLARAAFGASAPRSVALAAAVIGIGTLAMMAVGSLIAATAGNAQVAYGVGMLVFMACLFTAGMWTPGPMMTPAMQLITGFTPLGAMSQALTSAWYQGTADIVPFIVMSVWAVLCGLISVRTFRWR